MLLAEAEENLNWHEKQKRKPSVLSVEMSGMLKWVLAHLKPERGRLVEAC